jgi:hypothetical protein
VAPDSAGVVARTLFWALLLFLWVGGDWFVAG